MISHHCATSYFVFKFLGGSQRQNWLQSVLWPTVGSHRLKTKPKRIAGGTVVPKGSNPPKEGSLDVISRVFPSNYQHFDFRFRLLYALHIQNLSNCYRHKYDQSISRIFQSYFWRVFATGPNCAERWWQWLTTRRPWRPWRRPKLRVRLLPEREEVNKQGSKDSLAASTRPHMYSGYKWTLMKATSMAASASRLRN